jgi:hypothetical protein
VDRPVPTILIAAIARSENAIPPIFGDSGSAPVPRLAEFD